MSPYTLLILELTVALGIVVALYVRTSAILKKLDDQDDFHIAIKQLEHTLKALVESLREGRGQYREDQAKNSAILNSIAKTLERLENKK